MNPGVQHAFWAWAQSFVVLILSKFARQVEHGPRIDSASSLNAIAVANKFNAT